ncbi:MAG TPA: CdaR family protein [Candidatus Limnocylindrales bacterium]
MRRAIGFLLRNWPLKLAAILLATLLYSGFVLSQSTSTWTGSVPITVRGEGEDVRLLTNVGDVDRIRYVGPPTARVDSSTFEASIDVSGVEPTGEPRSVRVEVRSNDPQITVLSVEPARINVALARVTSKQVRVVVRPGVVPPGLQIGDLVADPAMVAVRGAEPDLDKVVEVQARVQVEPSGLDVDRDTELIPVDSLGEEVLSVNVSPATARVTIDVFSDSDTKTLPVVPTIVGTPASGFEVASIVVAPSVLSVSGAAAMLSSLVAVDTEPVSITGISQNLRAEVGLQLPDGASPITIRQVTVTVTLRRVTETRTYSAGIVFQDARSDRVYALSTDHVLVTVGGAPADLDRIVGQELVVTADVGDLEPGQHVVTVEPVLPAGVALVSLNPSSVTVTISVPPTPTPSAATSLSP